jgi:2-dehydropantoate 2-reductase
VWEKVARLAPLAAATALTQRPVGDLRDDPEWRARLESAIAEACAVAAAEDVDLDPADQWKIIDAMPADLTTSTARDVAAGRPSELDAITGSVVRAGRMLDVPTPTLDRLLEAAEERCRASSR